MDETSVTRVPASPTRAIVADEAFCGQAAAVLLCEPEPIHDAFIGEPAEEVLEMVRWALKHEQDPGFDAARAAQLGQEARARSVAGGPTGRGSRKRQREGLGWPPTTRRYTTPPRGAWSPCTRGPTACR